MDPFFRAQLILWFGALSAMGVHWFFMRGYNLEQKKKKQQQDREL